MNRPAENVLTTTQSILKKDSDINRFVPKREVKSHIKLAPRSGRTLRATHSSLPALENPISRTDKFKNNCKNARVHQKTQVKL